MQYESLTQLMQGLLGFSAVKQTSVVHMDHWLRGTV